MDSALARLADKLPSDEVPDVQPTSTGGESPVHQERSAQDADSTVTYLFSGDSAPNGMKVEKTFVEVVESDTPPKKCTPRYRSLSPRFRGQPDRAEGGPQKKEKKMFPDLKPRTEQECIQLRWASRNQALTSTAKGKSWNDGQCFDLGKEDYSMAKGSCTYCVRACIQKVSKRWKSAGGIGCLLDVYGLEIVLALDWESVETLPLPIQQEIWVEVGERCPHWQLPCPTKTCLSTQCHHYLHRNCGRGDKACGFCHCADQPRSAAGLIAVKQR